MSDYDYLNARVRGMSTELLDAEFYDDLVACDGVHGVTDALLDTAYGAELREALARNRELAAAERALRENVASSFARLRALAPAEPRRLLNVQFSRWDVANVRAVVRGKATGVDEEDILSAVLPVGELDRGRLAALASASDVSASLELLTVWNYSFGPAVVRAAKQKSEAFRLTAFERAVDAAYFKWALAQLSQDDDNQAVVLDMLRRQVDLANATNALRVVRQREMGRDVQPVEPIPGGRISSSTVESMMRAESLEGSLEILETTYFAPGIEKGILAFGERRKLGLMERFLENVVMEEGCSLFRTDPLKVGVPLGYVWRKYSEFVNLRILLRGKAHGIPPNMIREELVFA